MGTLKINSENILPIIKQWLYSDRDIFLRELVSNASDALIKMKRIAREENLEIDSATFQVTVSLDSEKKLLTISDNGIGMTADEVETYIAQLAFSGAEEFVKKYKNEGDSDPIIGHFGLGFYSSFMVSSLVEIETLSYKEGATPAFWSCDGSSEYTLREGSRSTRGTTITLHLSDDEFSNIAYVREILLKYCRFLPFPLYLDGTLLNAEVPLFTKAPSECTEEEYKQFYRTLYPQDADPIFWIHLNVDYPFNLKGILYFPKLDRHTNFDRSNIQLYCNRIFVSDHCNGLLPDFLTVLKGALDSPDIPLNVSRSTLQMDRTVRSVAAHIAKKVADRLLSLYEDERETFIKTWPDIELVLKLGALQDEKFYDRIQDILIWKNSSGEWTNLANYAERNAGSKIFYANDETTHCLNLFKERGKEVLFFRSHLDSPLVTLLERKNSSFKFQRIDAELDESLLDKEREKSLLDASGKSESAQIADFFRSQLGKEPMEVEAKSLASETLPAMVLIDEQQRRFREYLTLSNQSGADFFKNPSKFVLNTNHKLVNAIYGLRETDPSLAQMLATHLFDQTLLSQRELDPEKIPEVTSRFTEILEAVLKL